MKSVVIVVLLSLAAGSIATAFSMLYRYQFCMDGPGRGWPFAVVHPIHGDEYGNEPSVLPLGPPAKCGRPGVDLLGALGNVVFWGTCPAVVLGRFCVWRRRRTVVRRVDGSRPPLSL